MRTGIWTGGFVAALVFGATPSALWAAQSDVAAGAKVYAENCGRCHNPRSSTERTDREWTVIINHMRVRAGLTGGQARQVLAFLQETNGLPSPASSGGAIQAPLRATEPEAPADANRGRALVEARGCAGCHVVGKTGGTLGPSLNGVVARRGEEYVIRKLGNPAFDNPNTMMPRLDLRDAETQSILEYLKTLARSSP